MELASTMRVKKNMKEIKTKRYKGKKKEKDPYDKS
jgi:hypothetical protein